MPPVRRRDEKDRPPHYHQSNINFPIKKASVHEHRGEHSRLSVEEQQAQIDQSEAGQLHRRQEMASAAKRAREQFEAMDEGQGAGEEPTEKVTITPKGAVASKSGGSGNGEVGANAGHGGGDLTDRIPPTVKMKPYQTFPITFHRKVLVEKMGHGKVYALMMQQFINQLWDLSNLNKFKGIVGADPSSIPKIFTHYEYGKINLKLSKILFQQEGIQIGDTPGATTAPSQSSYLWEYKPPKVPAPYISYGQRTGESSHKAIEYTNAARNPAGLNANLLRELKNDDGTSVEFQNMDVFYGAVSATGVKYSQAGSNGIQTPGFGRTMAGQGYFLGNGNPNGYMNRPGNSYLKTNDTLIMHQKGAVIDKSFEPNLGPMPLRIVFPGEDISVSPTMGDVGSSSNQFGPSLHTHVRRFDSSLDSPKGSPVWGGFQNMPYASNKYKAQGEVNYGMHIGTDDHSATPVSIFSVAPLEDANGNQIPQSASMLAELDWTVHIYCPTQLVNMGTDVAGLEMYNNNMRDIAVVPPVFLSKTLNYNEDGDGASITLENDFVFLT